MHLFSLIYFGFLLLCCRQMLSIGWRGRKLFASWQYLQVYLSRKAIFKPIFLLPTYLPRYLFIYHYYLLTYLMPVITVIIRHNYLGIYLPYWFPNNLFKKFSYNFRHRNTAFCSHGHAHILAPHVCWMNFANNFNLFSVLPVGIMTALAFILGESLIEYDPLPSFHPQKYYWAT